MSLAPGAKLGSYEVLSPIGAGGMGEVWRARDTKLNRDVALKVLPEVLSRDPERMARFKREAQLLASLNHPNIAAIYGFEESDNTRALVMELVEGQTLAEKILVAQGPLSDPAVLQPSKETEKPQRRRAGAALQVDDALPIAKQIAEGLEYAHERGIIHRDLKPANIKVTPEGTVKILDFGLAKALDPAVEAGSSRQSGDVKSPLQDSPTLTAAATQAGVILGTAAYMSPEQARGKPVDRRADIWAFGCVLFEMFTGKRTFEGETVSDTLAAVLKTEPDWDALPASTPPRIEELIRRCLTKDPKQRLRDIGDARIAIEETLRGGMDVEAGLPRQDAGGGVKPPLQRALLAAGFVAIGAILAALVTWRIFSSQGAGSRPVTRFSVVLPSGDQLARLNGTALALSPDGRKLVYVAKRGETTELFLRSLDQFEARPLEGTEGASSPFFSPDGQWIGFSAGDGLGLEKVSAQGGPPISIAKEFGLWGGAWWADDGTIVFSSYPESGLWKVSDSGGTPRSLTTVERRQGERNHRWPQVLPNGDILFNVLVGNSWDDARIELFSPRTGQRQVIIQGGDDPRYVAPGFIVYARAGDLVAVPFDLKSEKVTGPPAPVLKGIRTDSSGGAAAFTVSRDGSLAYVPGQSTSPENTLVWVDRQGHAGPVEAPARDYSMVRISPDGNRVAAWIGGYGVVSDVWVYDLTRKTLTRLTTDGRSSNPAWSPDGKRVAYSSMREFRPNLYWANADGSGEERLSTSEESAQVRASFYPDGRLLAFTGLWPDGSNFQYGIEILPLEGKREPRRFSDAQFNTDNPEFSPDGHWLAYTSAETGRGEVYVRPYPGPGAKVQVSNQGGGEPRWARDGKELYYRNGNKMMAVPVTLGAQTKLGTLQELFELDSMGDYDVAPDGKRFLMIKHQPATPVTQISVVLNWTEELKKASATPSGP